MKITISTLFFYNPDLCKEFISEILPSVVEHADRGIDSVEFVISDNTPESESILKEIAPRLESLHSPTLRFTLHHNEYNNGFGGSHNRVFQESESDIFIVLNNDLFFKKTSKEPNWIEVLCAPLRAENSIAIVGVVSSPSVINDEGEGRWLETKTQVPDYAEGSILAIRSHVAKRLGLFATDLGIAYFEDSDLSLRFRQAGYQLAFVEIPHEHRRGSSSKILDPDLLTSIRAKNKTRFLTRWKQYLKKRSFTNRIFLDFTSGGWGDVVAAVPVVTGMLRDHPTAEIELQTNQKGLKNLFEFPRVTVRTEDFKTVWQATASNEFDRIFSLTEVDYASVLQLGLQISLDAGVDFDMVLAQKNIESLNLQPSSTVQQVLQSAKNSCVVHVHSFREDWEGRSLSSEHLITTLQAAKEKGFHLVLVGTENDPTIRAICDFDLTGLTTLEDIFHLVKNAKLFFGMDSGPLHFAQFFHIPTFAVFGATLPTARLLNMDNSYGYTRADLDCIGCYHRHVQSPKNFCIRRDEACVKKIDSKDLLNQFNAWMESRKLKWTFDANIREERHALAVKQMIQPKVLAVRYPELSDARLRQLIAALFMKLKRMFRDLLK